MCRYHVDSTGCITFVDESWSAFARANDAPQYADLASLYGRPLLSCISDNTTQHVYAVLMDRVRAQQVTVRVPFRCDAPALRRWLELEMSPRPANGIAFVSRELRTEPRDPVPVPADPGRDAGGSLIRMCSWCKRVDAGAARWLDIEQAIAEMGLFAGPRTSPITHGICGDCREAFESGAGYSIDPV